MDESGNELGTVLFNLGNKTIMGGDTINDVSFDNVEISQGLSLGNSYPDVSQTLANIESSLSTLNTGVGSITTSQWTENVGQGIYYDEGSVAVGKNTINTNYKLDVSGDIHLSGSIYQNGALFSSGDKTDFIVTVQSGKYLLDGVSQYIPTFKSGQTYTFDQNDSTNSTHPIGFYLDAAKLTQYTSGVSTSSGVTSIVIDDSTPTKLYYQCKNHEIWEVLLWLCHPVLQCQIVNLHILRE